MEDVSWNILMTAFCLVASSDCALLRGALPSPGLAAPNRLAGSAAANLLNHLVFTSHPNNATVEVGGIRLHTAEKNGVQEWATTPMQAMRAIHPKINTGAHRGDGTKHKDAYMTQAGVTCRRTDSAEETEKGCMQEIHIGTH